MMEKARTSVLLAFVGVVGTGGCGGGPAASEVAHRIQALTEPPGAPEVLERAGLGSVAEPVEEFYLRRNGAPVWVEGEALSGKGRAVVRALCRADREGLSPARYGIPLLRDLVTREAGPAEGSEPGPGRRAVDRSAEVELVVAAALAAYGPDVATGRISPAARGAEVHLPPRRLEPLPLLESAAAADRAGEVLASLPPPHPEYRALREHRERVREAARRDTGRRIPAGTYRRGDTARAVLLLRRKLAPDLPRGRRRARSTVFDATLERAVKRFQARHGLDTTGVVEEATRAALEAPARERIRRLELNMERWRWLPAELASRHVRVNLPAYRLAAHEAGRSVLEMSVVVGAAYRGRATPVFSDTMTFVEFAPVWHVPDEIALEETLPRARAEPGFLERAGYEIIPTGDGAGEGEVAEDEGSGADAPALPSEAGETDWAAVAEGIRRGRLRVQQRPGPENALGRVKFLFPNQHAVYLHDTPERELFERARRTFSHGCIRVARPGDLAAFCLADQGWDPGRIREAMSSDRTRRVTLEDPIPVYILYLTAFTDRRGRLHFREDVYGYDATLRETLAAFAPTVEERETARAACDDLARRF